MLQVGQQLAGYRIIRPLGQGGMAAVFLAEQATLQREVALKVLLPDLAKEPHAVARFAREARTAGGLSHPCIVPIFEIGEAGGVHFFSMEYVEGLRLDQYMRWRGPLRLDEGVALMERVLSALATAHAHKVVHRDLKPSNIMLDTLGHVRVLDFGIATAREGVDGQDLTQTNMTMGTPRYMAPEQCLAKPVDPRTDLYTLGTVAWSWWAGRPPFDAPTAAALQMHHCQTPAPSLRTVRADLPVALDDVLLRMMAKEKDDRPAAAEAVLDTLSKLPVARRPTRFPVREAMHGLERGDAPGSGTLAPADPDPTPTYPPRRNPPAAAPSP